MEPTSQEYLIANLKKLMTATDLNSQFKLADASGVSQTNISNILRGAIHPQLGTIEALAGAFDVEPWQLLAPDVFAATYRPIK